MKVWHRIRQEMAGAFRSLRYDLTRRHGHGRQPRGRLAGYTGLAVLCGVVCVAMFYTVIVVGGTRSLPHANGQPTVSDPPAHEPSATPVASPAPADIVDTAPGQLSAPPTGRSRAPAHRPTEGAPTKRPSPSRPPPPSSPTPSPTPSQSPSDTPPPTSTTPSPSPHATGSLDR